MFADAGHARRLIRIPQDRRRAVVRLPHHRQHLARVVDQLHVQPRVQREFDGADRSRSSLGTPGQTAYQYSATNSQTWTATFDTTNYTDIPAGNYYVEVSWAYFNTDNVNATNRPSIGSKGVTISNSINQNRTATNQGGSFSAGNSMGSWSGFYPLDGILRAQLGQRDQRQPAPTVPPATEPSG